MREHPDALYSHLMDDFEWDYVSGGSAAADVLALCDAQPVDEEDMVNSPKHYTQGKMEAIDVIEDAIRHAPDPVVGMLQAQVLKYTLRCWHKGKPQEDLEKSAWYLKRLIKAIGNVE